MGPYGPPLTSYQGGVICNAPEGRRESGRHYRVSFHLQRLKERRQCVLPFVALHFRVTLKRGGGSHHLMLLFPLRTPTL